MQAFGHDLKGYNILDANTEQPIKVKELIYANDETREIRFLRTYNDGSIQRNDNGVPIIVTQIRDIKLQKNVYHNDYTELTYKSGSWKARHSEFIDNRSKNPVRYSIAKVSNDIDWWKEGYFTQISKAHSLFHALTCYAIDVHEDVLQNIFPTDIIYFDEIGLSDMWGYVRLIGYPEKYYIDRYYNCDTKNRRLFSYYYKLSNDNTTYIQLSFLKSKAGRFCNINDIICTNSKLLQAGVNIIKNTEYYRKQQAYWKLLEYDVFNERFLIDITGYSIKDLLSEYSCESSVENFIDSQQMNKNLIKEIKEDPCSQYLISDIYSRLYTLIQDETKVKQKVTFIMNKLDLYKEHEKYIKWRISV